MRSAKEYKAIREEIYRFIGAYITKHVYAPSNREIAEAVGISGTTVHRHLRDMIDEGILETDAEPGTQRAIRIRNTQVVKRRKKSESPMIGGHPGGQIAYTMGIVEYMDGTVDRVYPEYIRFLDTEDFAGDCNE